MRYIFLILLFLGIPFKILFAQQFGIKAGLGFPSIYQTDEVNYYRNRLNHESSPSFIFSLRLNWHLTGNLYIAWEPGVIEKSGKITGIATGFDSQYNDIYGYREYKLWNIENSVLLNYNLFIIKDKDIVANILVGPGLAWNISDKQQFVAPKQIVHYYTDYPNVDYQNPYITNNSGFYLNAGLNLRFKKFQLDIKYLWEYYDLWVNGLGKYRYYLLCFLLGYEF